MSNSSDKNPSADTISMGDILMMAPEDGPLSEGLRTKLDEYWVDRDPQDLANLGVPGVMKELLAVLPDSETDPTDDQPYSNTKRLAVARAVIALLGSFDYRKVGVVTAQAPRVSPTIYRIERNYAEMSLRQLLDAIIANPDAYNEAKSYINSHRELAAALRKTYEWVVPLAETPTDDTPNIDVDNTVAYVAALSERFYQPQTVLPNGRRPMSLDRAMEVNNQPLIQPVTGELVRGPWKRLDLHGFAMRDEELYKAAIWARITRHELLPEGDPRRITRELIDGTNSDWEDIRADYLEAVRRQHSSVDGIRVYWPEDLPEDQLFVFGTVAVDYEALVRENVLSVYNRTGSGQTVKASGYRTVYISGSGATFYGTIVIEGGSVHGSGASGTIYAPPGVDFSVHGSGSSVDVVTLSWKQIAERLKLV